MEVKKYYCSHRHWKFFYLKTCCVAYSFRDAQFWAFKWKRFFFIWFSFILTNVFPEVRREEYVEFCRISPNDQYWEFQQIRKIFKNFEKTSKVTTEHVFKIWRGISKSPQNPTCGTLSECMLIFLLLFSSKISAALIHIEWICIQNRESLMWWERNAHFNKYTIESFIH